MSEKCPTCGGDVRIVGKTTMHYEPKPIPFGTVTLDDAEVEALAQDRDRWMHAAKYDPEELRLMEAVIEAAREAEGWLDHVYANGNVEESDLDSLKEDGLRLNDALAALTAYREGGK